MSTVETVNEETLSGSKDGVNIIPTSGKLSMVEGTTPVAVPQAALTTAATTLTNAGTASDYAIQALTNTSPYGFVTQAEGETVVDVVLNNQARINEIEARLQALGIIS